MICPKEGFTILCHNKARDFIADLLSEVCHNVEVEPKLQTHCPGKVFPIKPPKESTRLDVEARGFWDPMQCAFFDVRVFYPNTQSNH